MKTDYSALHTRTAWKQAISFVQARVRTRLLGELRSKSPAFGGRAIHFASVAAAVIATLYLAACQQSAQGPDSIPASEKAGAVLPMPAESPGSNTVSGPFVYTVAQGDEGSHLEKTPVKVTGSQEEAAVTLLNKMAEAQDSPLPRGTRALSVEFRKDGLAVANFNPALKANFAGGDQAEALMLNAITGTLAQYPDVKKVQILVDGQKEAIGGLQDTTEPLDVPLTDGTQVSEKGEGN